MRVLNVMTCGLVAVGLLAGCSQQRSDTGAAVADAADKMEKAAGDAKEAVEEAADDAKDAAEKTAKKAEKAAKDMADVVIPDGMTEIDSSAMKAVQYDADKKTLEILFPNGDTYSYKGVSQKVFDGLMEAKSKGKYYAQHLKGKLGEAKK